MSINFANAVAAYNKSAAKLGGPGVEPRDQPVESGFAKLLRSTAEDAIGSLRAAETSTLQAAAGTADVNDVVAAVNQADLALQTVVAVRDRVIQAYQDILRMPI